MALVAPGVGINVNTEHWMDMHYAELFIPFWSQFNKYLLTHSNFITAGSLELDSTRSDRSQFPDSVLGKKYEGWNEKYIDIRSPIVRDIMAARIKAAHEAGCDAIDPDNTELASKASDDGYESAADDPIGFNITSVEVMDYLRFLSKEARSYQMAIGLKNNAYMIEKYPQEVVDLHDFVVTEACYVLGNCDTYEKGFIENEKPVFNIEYLDTSGGYEDGGCSALTASVVKTAAAGSNVSFVYDACNDLNQQNFETYVKDCALKTQGVACQRYNSGGVRSGPTVPPEELKTYTAKSSARTTMSTKNMVLGGSLLATLAFSWLWM
jgi:hypothetical protein